MQKPSVRCSGVEAAAAAGGAGGRQGASSGEVGGEEAERLVLVGGQRRAVALVGARDAAAGGARAVAEGLDAALPLQLWGGGQKGRQQLDVNPPSEISDNIKDSSKRFKAIKAQMNPQSFDFSSSDSICWNYFVPFLANKCYLLPWRPVGKREAALSCHPCHGRPPLESSELIPAALGRVWPSLWHRKRMF